MADDYPLTRARVILGRALFYEAALSRNGRVTCGTCHVRRFALTERRPVSRGIDGQSLTRNAMPLINVGWKPHFFWDGRVQTLREQVLVPIQDPQEMDQKLDEAVRKLSRSETYRDAFEGAYGDPQVTVERIAVALEQFVLTRTSFDSKFDRAQRGEVELTYREQRGQQLFMNPRGERSAEGRVSGAGCAHCHAGPQFSDHHFRNNGLVPANGDVGREAVTGKSEDRHRFVTPSLRNVALTGPYMHDGRFDTLEEVIDHYASGVHPSDTLDPSLVGENSVLDLGEDDKAVLVAFLETLSDPKYRAE